MPQPKRSKPEPTVEPSPSELIDDLRHRAELCEAAAVVLDQVLQSLGVSPSRPDDPLLTRRINHQMAELVIGINVLLRLKDSCESSIHEVEQRARIAPPHPGLVSADGRALKSAKPRTRQWRPPVPAEGAVP